MPSERQILDSYKEKLFEEAEKLVLEEFPKKVIEFNALLENGQFSYERLPELLPDTDLNIPRPMEIYESLCVYYNLDDLERRRTPVYGFVNGIVKCNEKLAELTDITRPMLRDAVEAVNKVKMWILFLIPRIEDGNNFGVSIQEEALSEVRTVEGEAASFLDQMSRYFVSRARLVTKVAKYPHVEDYRRAILDMDEKQFINIRLVLTEMRNHFATLHDMITKNYEKIKTPRSNNTEHMY
uniref:Proteasome activator complex subunit 3 n=1 Tax=Syphacia muris TaxID=451379 RepID=A0A0N5AHQ9_9BILA